MELEQWSGIWIVSYRRIRHRARRVAIAFVAASFAFATTSEKPAVTDRKALDLPIDAPLWERLRYSVTYPQHDTHAAGIGIAVAGVVAAIGAGGP